MQEDMDLLYAATKIGNREMACFWEAPWLNGEKSKYIAPLILMISTRTKWNIKTALHENGWVSKIKMEDLIIVYILSNL
jgi:hypothetical protein